MSDTSKIPLSRVNELIDKLNEINNKINSMKYVVETNSNENGWYRVWSDGWIEQGGQVYYNNVNAFVTVTYLKPFKHEPNIQITTKGSYYTNSFAGQHACNAQISTNTNFTTYIDVNVPYKNWYACGY